MEIFLYTLSVMYSPGPVNFIGLNTGLTGQLKRTIGFFIGVGCAMFSLFIILGYTGEALISHKHLPYIALMGALYTYSLAYKMISSHIEVSVDLKYKTEKQLTFFDGFLIQALNPKGMLVVLPVTTVMFPSSHITGMMIFFVSLLISIGGGVAPALYSYIGEIIGKRIRNNTLLNNLNKLMGCILLIVAFFMTRDFLTGINLM